MDQSDRLHYDHYVGVSKFPLLWAYSLMTVAKACIHHFRLKAILVS